MLEDYLGHLEHVVADAEDAQDVDAHLVALQLGLWHI
jgi:hypothetical protein